MTLIPYNIFCAFFGVVYRKFNVFYTFKKLLREISTWSTDDSIRDYFRMVLLVSSRVNEITGNLI